MSESTSIKGEGAPRADIYPRITSQIVGALEKA